MDEGAPMMAILAVETAGLVQQADAAGQATVVDGLVVVAAAATDSEAARVEGEREVVRVEVARAAAREVAVRAVAVVCRCK